MLSEMSEYNKLRPSTCIEGLNYASSFICFSFLRFLQNFRRIFFHSSRYFSFLLYVFQQQYGLYGSSRTPKSLSVTGECSRCLYESLGWDGGRDRERVCVKWSIESIVVVGTLIGGVQAVGTFIKERSTCRGRSVWQNGHVKRVNSSVRSRSSRSAEQVGQRSASRSNATLAMLMRFCVATPRDPIPSQGSARPSFILLQCGGLPIDLGSPAATPGQGLF